MGGIQIITTDLESLLRGWNALCLQDGEICDGENIIF